MEEKVKDRRLSFSYLLTELKALLIIIAIFIACFVGGWFFSNLKSNKAYKLLLDQNNEIRESLTVADNKAVSLESLLSGRDQETEDLRRIIAAFEEKLNHADGRVLVSIMLANNETGVIQSVSELSKIARKYGALLHTDAVQACGKIEFDRASLGVDFISLSAHKIGGPQGVGALIVSEDVAIGSDIKGGGQERGRRAGTENLPGIAGVGVAGEIAGAFSDVVKIRDLRDRLETSVKKITPETIVYGENVDRLPNTSSIFMPGVKSETQIMKFDLKGIMISAGSACSSGKVQSSHVLRAMGVDNDVASNVIRISLGSVNTIDDIDYFVREWKQIYMSANVNKLMEVA